MDVENFLLVEEGAGHGSGGSGCGRFVCTHCEKAGHLKDPYWYKYPHLHSVGSYQHINGGGMASTTRGIISGSIHATATPSINECPVGTFSFTLNLSRLC